jgi:hypothetical protein
MVVRVGTAPAAANPVVSDNGSIRPGPGWPPDRLVELLRHTAWPLAALFLGIVLAVGAILLTYAELSGGIAVFLLAAVALVAGLAGLLFQNMQETIRDESRPAEAARELQVYRKTPCAIDRRLLDKLARAADVLKTRVHDHHWEADWETFQRHHESAERLLARGELTPAFREYCRAMRPLVEVVHRQRGGEESFQPVWERARD